MESLGSGVIKSSTLAKSKSSSARTAPVTLKVFACEDRLKKNEETERHRKRGMME